MANSKKVKLSFPPWVAGVYTFFAIILVPWTIFLALKLPGRHLSQHWDVAWVGLDIAIVIGLFLTGYTASLKSKWVAICATATATLLVLDAWFDIVTARAGVQLNEAIILAIFIEVPLAISSYILAHKAISDNF